MLAGEHLAGAAEADGNFVGDKQRVVAARQLGQASQIAWRMHDHAGGGLHERFDHDCGDSLVLVSARRLGGEAQVSVLVRDATGWHAGPWVSLLPQQRISLVWSRDAAGRLLVGIEVD